MLNASTVNIVLDGEDRELVCTIEAVIVMSKAYGGMLAIYDRIKALDIEAMTVAIRAGLNVDGPEAVGLMEKVYKTGLMNLQPFVGSFVLLAASGGVRADDDEGEDDSDAPGKPST